MSLLLLLLLLLLLYNVTGVKPALQNAIHIQRAIVMSAALLTSPCL